MRKAMLLGTMVAGMLAVAPVARATFLNAPHNGPNGLDCVNCHEYPFDRWPGFVSDPADPDSTIRNFVCLRCHDGSADGPGEIAAPLKVTHSSQHLSAKYGTWSIQCTDCHDPHFQAQVDYYQADGAGLYLVTGTYQGVSVDTAATPVTSTITYSLVQSDPQWSNPASWPAKTGPGRGLILVADTAAPYDTFEVVAADGATITVSGDLSQVGQGATFGLIYGGLVRSEIATPNSGTRQVKFFSGTAGGFVDSGTPPAGICQVCHTQTHHWRNDGTLADHNAGAACTSCHRTAAGFQASVPDHTVVDSLGNVPIEPTAACVTCHTYTDPVADIHKGNCNYCHTATPPALNTGLTPGQCAGCHADRDANGHVTEHDATAYEHTPSQEDPAISGQCATCHDPMGFANINSGHVGRVVKNGEVNGTATIGQTISCATCHQSAVPAVQSAIAAGKTGTVVACADCHGVRPMPHGGHDSTAFGYDSVCGDCHTGAVVSAVHGGACAVCHVDPATGNYARREGDPANGIDGDARLALDQTATCTVCHPAAVDPAGRATIHHDSKGGFALAGDCAACHGTTGHGGDHAARVALYADCARCHTGTQGTAAGMVVDDLDPKKHDACVTCHRTDGSLKALGDLSRGIVVAMPAGGGDCAACHGQYFTSHQNIDHGSSRVTASANCANCHDATAGGSAPDALVPPFAGAGEVHGVNGCFTCHQADGGLVGPTAVAPGIAAGGGDCETCHGAYFTRHQSPNHAARVAGVAPCTDCHTATAGTVAGIPTSAADPKVHDGCATCHNTTTGLLLARSAANVNGYLTYGSAMAAGPCTTCHGDYFDHHVHGTSTGYVSHDVAHDPTVDLSQTAPGTPCRNCHDDAGLGKGTNALSTWEAILTEHATVGGVAQGSACATCHGYRTNGNQSGDLDTPPLTVVEGTIAGGTSVTCVTCHVPKDVNASPATSGHGGHGPATFAWAGNCNTCHSDNGLGVVEGVHHNTCTLCHDNPSGGPGTTIVGANGNGDATLAAGANYASATCLTCHPSSSYPAPAIHHDTAHAQSGDCEWCHADPRPGWATQYNVNLPNPLPTSDMACKKCHVKGTGTGLTVYRNSFTPQNVTSFPNGSNRWGVNGDAAVQQTPVHVINGAALITVQNYGICLGCHDGTYTNAQGRFAKQIQVWHAKPTWDKTTNDTQNGVYDNTFDVMRNAPGRSYFANNNTPPKGGTDANANDRRFNIFSTGANTGGVAKVRMYGRYWFGSSSKPYEKTNSESRGKGLYKNYKNTTDNPWIRSVWSNRRTIPRINAINNPQGLLTSDPQVPIVP